MSWITEDMLDCIEFSNFMFKCTEEERMTYFLLSSLFE